MRRFFFLGRTGRGLIQLVFVVIQLRTGNFERGYVVAWVNPFFRC
jgi:hypothetical protein